MIIEEIQIIDAPVSDLEFWVGVGAGAVIGIGIGLLIVS